MGYIIVIAFTLLVSIIIKGIVVHNEVPKLLFLTLFPLLTLLDMVLLFLLVLNIALY